MTQLVLHATNMDTGEHREFTGAGQNQLLEERDTFIAIRRAEGERWAPAPYTIEDVCELDPVGNVARKVFLQRMGMPNVFHPQDALTQTANVLGRSTLEIKDMVRDEYEAALDIAEKQTIYEEDMR